MAKRNQINVKVNNPTNEAIEEFADSYDFTKAEAVRRMVEDRLTGEGYLDQPTGKAVPDGGAIEAKLETVHSDLEGVQSEVQAESDRYQKTLSSILVAVVWIGIVATVELPSIAVIGSGLGLIGPLLYFYLEES